MLGLAELYQSVRTAALKQQRQPQLVSVFTTELFAHYLHMKYLSVTEGGQFMQTSSTNEFKRYEVCMSDTQQLFLGDVLLFMKVCRLLVLQHRPIWLKDEHTSTNTQLSHSPELAEILHKSAAEQLTTYRQFEARDFGSVVTIVTTDFEACLLYTSPSPRD